MASRHEERIIRPFVGLDDLNDVFSEFTLTVCGFKASPNAFIPTDLFKEITLDLKTFWSPKEVNDAIEILGLKPDEVHYAVYLLGRTLKRVSLVRDASLAELANPETSISLTYTDAPHIFGDKVSGFDVVVVLYLKKGREAKPLTVYEEGTWLAKKDFTVRPERGLSLFSPTPMDAKRKVELGLPKKTLFYLEMNNESMFLATEVEQAFTFYVDETFFILVSDERSNASQAMALLMVRQALSGVTSALAKSLAGKNLESFTSEIEAGEHDDTVGVRLLKSIKKKIPGKSMFDILEMAAGEPEKLVSHLDDSMNLAGEILRVTKKEDE
jgi:hypothetical protein